MEKKSCVICKDQSHPIYKCNKFTDASVTQKWNWTKQHKMCSNCLNTNHQLADCTSTYRCRHCGEQHNYLLHKDEEIKKGGASLTTVKTKNLKKNGAGFIHTALMMTKCLFWWKLCDEAKEMVLNCQVAGYIAAMEELQENYGKKSVIEEWQQVHSSQSCTG